MQIQHITPKNKTGGVVSNTVFGVGGLIIAVIVLLVITSTIFEADLFENVRVSNSTVNGTANTVVNETGSGFGGHTMPSNYDPRCTITQVRNSTGVIIASTEYTQTNCLVQYNIADNDTYNNSVWQFDYSLSIDGAEKLSSDDMEKNLTVGIGKISSKIPTILLIVAVVFLFGALVLLLRNARFMGIGDGGSL